jgi:hypothetical protein
LYQASYLLKHAYIFATRKGWYIYQRATQAHFPTSQPANATPDKCDAYTIRLSGLRIVRRARIGLLKRFIGGTEACRQFRSSETAAPLFIHNSRAPARINVIPILFDSAASNWSLLRDITFIEALCTRYHMCRSLPTAVRRER